MPEYPHTFPTWRFWPGGDARIVTEAEWPTLPPGHEDTPAKFAGPAAPLVLNGTLLPLEAPPDPEPMPVPRKRGRPRKEPS